MEDGALLVKPRYEHCVFVGDPLPVDQRALGVWLAHDIGFVLDGHRDAIQCAERLATLVSVFRRPRLLQRLFKEGVAEGIDVRLP